MSASRAVGIDLGTTHCAMAQLDATGRSAMIRSPQGDLLIKSVVYFEDEELLFGRAANQAAATNPQRAAECAKRDFGQAAYSRAIGGELLPPELIEACLLKFLCLDLPVLLGAAPAVALSVPSSFDQAQRRGMIDAARIAGLDVLGTINDPLATALSFAEVQGYLSADGAKKPTCRVLVFDLGGGKLDAAIVEIKPGQLRTLAVAGDARLGGRDWDDQLAEYLAAKFEKQFGDDPRYDMASVRRLITSAEEAKHTLTARLQARVHIERHGAETDVVVQRHAFEEAAGELVERARTIAESVVAQAGMAWRDLSHLLLVGGATRMPMIAGMIESVTGLKAATTMHADEAVARGAVLYAEQLLAAREGRALAATMNITDMTAYNVGMEWREHGADHAENVVLIPRGAELPRGTTSNLLTDVDDQTSAEVQLLEGNSRDADACRRIARVKISGLPSELPRKSVIDVLYQITAEGRLQVKAQLQKGGLPLAIEVERASGMTEAEVGAWKKLLDTNPGLKAIHRQLSHHAARRPPDAPPPLPAAPLPPLPRAGAAVASAPLDFELDVGDGAATRLRKNGSASRKILIMLAGHVVFAALGLAIGYYILMWLRPEWNVLHLRLPGLRVDSPQNAVWPLNPR
ncbi:MAG: Hsp70 family protein [Pirellulales bacterium]